MTSDMHASVNDSEFDDVVSQMVSVDRGTIYSAWRIKIRQPTTLLSRRLADTGSQSRSLSPEESSRHATQ